MHLFIIIQNYSYQLYKWYCYVNQINVEMHFIVTIFQCSYLKKSVCENLNTYPYCSLVISSRPKLLLLHLYLLPLFIYKGFVLFFLFRFHLNLHTIFVFFYAFILFYALILFFGHNFILFYNTHFINQFYFILIAIF